MKKIISLCMIACSLISVTAFGMWNKCTKISKNISFVQQCNRRTQFNRAELLQQLEEQKHRLTPEKIASIKMFITSLPTESPCEPSNMEDRDFEHGNMNKE